MSTQRKVYNADFKAKVALAAIKGQQTVNEIASHYSVHPNQVMSWKKQALEAIPDSFSTRREASARADEELRAQLYQQIGQLKVELDWLKKKLGCSLEQRRQLIDAGHQQISLRRQCQLLGLHRSGLCYRPRGESDENLQLMKRLDEHYTRAPFYGVRRMTAWLQQQGYAVNEKRVRRWLRKMRLWAAYPKPSLSRRAPGAQVYPYLLKGVVIERVNQVWSTDITYIGLLTGFVYLVAIMDWREPLRAGVGSLEHIREQFLRGSFGAGIARGSAGNFQLRSRGAVYEPELYQSSLGTGHQDQHGGLWTGVG